MFDNVKICPTSGTCCLSSSIFANKLTISSVDTHFKSPNFSEMITLFCCSPGLIQYAASQKKQACCWIDPFSIHSFVNSQGKLADDYSQNYMSSKTEKCDAKSSSFSDDLARNRIFFYFLTNFKTTGRGIFLSSQISYTVAQTDPDPTTGGLKNRQVADRHLRHESHWTCNNETQFPLRYAQVLTDPPPTQFPN